MNFTTVITYAGRNDFNVAERQDCCVRALTLAAQTYYRRAHGIFAKLGRKPKKAFFYIENHRKVENAFGIKTQFVARSGTIGQFINKNRNGRYILRIKRHVFYVENGEAYDTREQNPKKKLLQAWRIIA